MKVLEYLCKRLERVMRLHLTPDVRCEASGLNEVRNQALPVVVVFLQIVFTIPAIQGAVVSPWISTEDFIPARTGENHFAEFGRQPGYIVVGIALSHAWVFQTSNEIRHNGFHVAGFQHEFVMFRLEEGRHVLRLLSLVE